MVLDVSLRRVTRVFDGVPAISQVSLDVARGERVWLRGSNGSGKSTLLQVVATALSPTRLKLRDCRRLDGDDGLVWLRYDGSSPPVHLLLEAPPSSGPGPCLRHRARI